MVNANYDTCICIGTIQQIIHLILIIYFLIEIGWVYSIGFFFIAIIFCTQCAVFQRVKRNSQLGSRAYDDAEMEFICFLEIIFSIYYNLFIMAIQFKIYIGDLSIFLCLNNFVAFGFLIFWINQYREYRVVSKHR